MTLLNHALSVVAIAAPTLLMVAGCGSDGAGASEGSHQGGSGAGTGSATGTGGSGGTGGNAKPSDYTLGVVVIDVQETFVDYAANSDVNDVIARTGQSFQLAQEHALPFLLTFEASKQGDHALHAPLQPLVPPHSLDFIKTTFAATGLTSFRDAVSQSGVSHVVVMGAETDVCVMQTALGLRTMGFSVLLQRDAVLSSEPNIPPALRRMEQAGVVLVDEVDVATYAAAPEQLPPPPTTPPPTMMSPLGMGVVLSDFTDVTVNANSDPLKLQKEARLRELLLVSEWFERPVYVNDVAAGLPDAFASYYQEPLRPISQLDQDPLVTQLVFAGTDAGVTALMDSYLGTHDLFVMEDALLASGSAAAQQQALAPLFVQGLVPTTYKTFYYEMTRSVDPSEWPSPAWVAKFDEYYWITEAPEALPPIHP